MAQRYLKILLSAVVGPLAGLWFINNLLNWQTAVGAVGYALSQQNHSGYPIQLVPAVDSVVAASAGLILICTSEAAAAGLCLFGAWRLWLRRHAEEAVFSAAKQTAVTGVGFAVLTWFLGFQVIGGTGLMMGQAEGMDGAMRGAFTFGVYSFLTLIYLGLPDSVA
jgi:predicted small integral membrane protein